MKGLLDKLILIVTEVTLCFAESLSPALASAVVGTADPLRQRKGLQPHQLLVLSPPSPLRIENQINGKSSCTGDCSWL